MCGILGFGVAGLIGAVALVFGIGSVFNGMASLGTSLALLGQTLLQPVVMLFMAVLGFVAGVGFVLGAPSVVRFYYQVKSGQVEARALAERDEQPSQLRVDREPRLTDARVDVVRPARRRSVVSIDLERRL